MVISSTTGKQLGGRGGRSWRGKKEKGKILLKKKMQKLDKIVDKEKREL